MKYIPDITGTNRFKGHVYGTLQASLVRIGNRMVSDIRNSMGPGAGRKYKRGGVEHYASSPGQPPAPMSGRLRHSIMYTTSFGKKSDIGNLAHPEDVLNDLHPSSNELVLCVGSNVPYAYYLEKGTSHMRARPFLYTALMRNERFIRRELNVK